MAKSSSILKGEQAYIKQLQEWLGDKCKWNLRYRASRDGWDAQDFHRLCDNKGPTVVLIKVNNYIFGGYTDQNWAGKICSYISASLPYLPNSLNELLCVAISETVYNVVL